MSKIIRRVKKDIPGESKEYLLQANDSCWWSGKKQKVTKEK